MATDGVDDLCHDDRPAGWETRRIRHLALIRKGQLPNETFQSPSSESDLPYLSMEYLRGETAALAFVPDASAVVVAEAGDILLLWDGSNAGEFIRAKHGAVSSTVARIRPRHVDRDFLYYCCKAAEPLLRQQTVGMGIPHVDGDLLRDLKLRLPNVDGQRAIAAFLNAKTARLNELVVGKRALIAKLLERRSAAISSVVTRGFNPVIKFAPTSIEWLRHIPRHWKVTSLKRLAKSGRRSFTDGDWIELPFIADDGVRLIQTGNIGIGAYKEQGFRYITNEAFNELGCTAVEPNDVLICRLDGPVGRACLAPNLGVRMITSVDNTILKVREDVSPHFVVYLLSSAPWLSWIDSLCRVGGGFRMRVSRTMLGNIRLALPPHQEQCAITEYLDRETEGIDRMVGKIEEAVERLEEYRIALIVAAVTGKIDVRNQTRDDERQLVHFS